MSQPYSCGGRGCKRTFNKGYALKNHQNSCFVYQRTQEIKKNQAYLIARQSSDQGGQCVIRNLRTAISGQTPRPFQKTVRHNGHLLSPSNPNKRRKPNFMVDKVLKVSDGSLESQILHTPDKSESLSSDVNIGFFDDFEEYGEGWSGEDGLCDNHPTEQTPTPTKQPSQQPRRYRNYPRIFQDILPELVTPQEDRADDFTLQGSSMTSRVSNWFKTTANRFGLFREYYGHPDEGLQRTLSSAEVATSAALEDCGVPDMLVNSIKQDEFSPNNNPKTQIPRSHFLGPCKSISELFLELWFWNFGSRKTRQDREALVDLMCSPHFDPSDLASTDWRALDRALSDPVKETGMPGVDKGSIEAKYKAGSWIEQNITIGIPFKGRLTYDPTDNSARNSALPQDNLFTVSGVHVRSIPQLVRLVAATESKRRHWEWIAYTQKWEKQEAGKTRKQRIYGEVVSSDAFIEAYQEVQRIQSPPGCNLPKTVVPIHIWSDATHLGDFTNASLHPIYIGFGNESKYARSKPKLRSCHQVAFLPKIESELHDFVMKMGQTTGASPKLLSHVRRELIHGVWRILIDEDMIDGYENGWVVRCEDGIVRRIFPRFFTYSADYPEKVILACIRDLGGHPCPRCYVHKDKLDLVGTRDDASSRYENPRTLTRPILNAIRKARNYLFTGYTLGSQYIERLLKPKSLVPTISAFAEKLGRYGLDHYSMLVIDFMHEFELGIWRSFVHHLIRILQSRGDAYVQEFDRRIRLTAPFGVGTIRTLRKDTSQFKKFSAADYEDLLQVIIPAFEGLLPEPHNQLILFMLSVLATYHALGKLRLHTDDTLSYWEVVIRLLGDLLRHFRDKVCPQYETKETSREVQSRVKRNTKRGAASVDSSRREKVFNINTIKLHAMGDGPSTVRRYGTTDNYTTAVGETLHKTLKGNHRRTAKNQTSTRAITCIDIRTDNLLRLATANADLLPSAFKTILPQDPPLQPAKIVDQDFPLECHYQVATGKNDWFHIDRWLQENQEKEEIATKDFVPKLKSHIFNRLVRRNEHERFPLVTFEERSQLSISKNRIHAHRRLKIHFTTYDVRRGLDIINLDHRKRDVIVASDGYEHPFRYARIIGIWHVDCSFNDGPPERVDFLWVRWFTRVEGLETSQRNGLDKLAFEPKPNYQFGFISPNSIIRSCHLIPAWHYGQTAAGTAMFSDDLKGYDHRFYYANRFVDRDMFMRYLGGGVGHIGGGAQQYFQGETDTRWPSTSQRQGALTTPETRELRGVYNGGGRPPREEAEAGVLEPESEEDDEVGTDNDTVYSTESENDPSDDGSDYENEEAYGLD